MKKLLGWSIISTMAGAGLYMMLVSIGIKGTLVVIGGTVGIIGLLVVSILLVAGEL